MNETEAKQAAVDYIRNSFINIEIELCDSPPVGIYNSDELRDQWVYWFRLGSDHRIGGGDYLCVSKITGSVRYLGRYGE
jgi:hypothetical protein